MNAPEGAAGFGVSQNSESSPSERRGTAERGGEIGGGRADLDSPPLTRSPIEPEAAPDSVYHVLWAGRFHGLQIVADGKGVRETLDDPVSIHFPLPRHLWQIDLDFGEETNV